MNAISVARLQLVYPELSRRIYQMAQMLDFDIEVTQGLRTYAEQDALYNQVPQVTKARGGYSWHNFGLAVDIVPEISGTGIPDWNTRHPAWGRAIEVGESCGLVSGSTWRAFPDWPHFQLTGKFPVTPNDEVRAIYAQSGDIRDVWKAAFPMQVTDIDLGT